MRALVISGGGSKGAFAGGIAQYLIEKEQRQYDLYVGTSTGSLLLPHLALGEIEKLHDLYGSVTQKDIFNLNPFIIRKGHGTFSTRIHHFNVIRSFLRGNPTFGESKNLRALLQKNFSVLDFNALKENKTNIYVTVSNLSTKNVEYKSLRDCDYEDFLDWIWISANYIPFMSLVKKNGYQYADGGLGSVVPVKKAIELGAKTIDVIVLSPEHSIYNKLGVKNPFELMIDMFDFSLDQIEKQNVQIGELMSKEAKVTINTYYTPTVLTTNPLVFDSKMMRKWWQRGYLHAKSINQSKK